MPIAATYSVAERTRHKTFWRIIPFVFTLYVIAYIDRANVSFAKLAMAPDLGLSEAQFGFGAGIFFLSYILLEIPGALIVERWSARWWMARILVTWGICCILLGFIKSVNQFYLVRFLLGLAEGGFFPGIVVYLTHWFPIRDRARAMAGFLVASSGSMMIGAPISAALLSRDWFGVAAWRSMFILEGIPAVLFGFIVLFYMTDRPKDAKWLEAEEREWLISELETEKQAKKAFGHLSAWQVFRHRNVLLLLSTIFFQNLGLMAYVMWLPTMIQRASGSSAALSALLTTVPFGFGALAIYLAGRSSDRTGKRKLHVIVPAVVGAFFLALSAIPGQPFPLLFLWLTVTATAYSAGPSLWVLPTLTLTESAAASAIGLINIFAALGSFVGPSVVGLLLRMGYSYDTVVLILSASFLIQALSVSAVRVHRTVPSEK